MRGRLQTTSGQLLSEGDLFRYGGPSAVAGAVDEASAEYWVIGGMNVAEDTNAVLVIAEQRFDVRVVNGTLRGR